jgi:hypothetical protein
MRKRYTRRGSVGKASRKERRQRQAEKAREIQLTLNPEEVLAMLQDSLTDFATEMGLKVARLLLEDDRGEEIQRQPVVCAGVGPGGPAVGRATFRRPAVPRGHG